jgi:voltage-dependent potassium channel beta subunit
VEYRRLGRSGLEVSVFSLGTWLTAGDAAGADAFRPVLHAALDAGINLLDHAEVYADGEAERVMGRLLAELGPARRDDLILTSKVFWGGDGPNRTGLSRKRVFSACHAALRRLGTDHLDLYLCHRPDPDTPLDETALAMDILVRQGKVLYWGTSEWPASRIAAVQAICAANGWVPPTVEQPEYNLLRRRRVEVGLAAACTGGLGLMVWSPLASGVLTGKYDAGTPPGSRLARPELDWLAAGELAPPRRAAARALAPLAARLGVSRAALAAAWAAGHPSVSTVLLGATRPAQLTDTLCGLSLLTDGPEGWRAEAAAIVEGCVGVEPPEDDEGQDIQV